MTRSFIYCLAKIDFQCSRKNAVAGGLEMMIPLMGIPLVTVTQGREARLVVICSTKFVPVAVGKNRAG